MSRGIWWTAEEDEKLLRLRDGLGLGWKAIAEQMPGRSTASCEQRYYNKLKDARDRTPRPKGPAPKRGAKGYWRRPVIVNVPLAPKPAPVPAPAPAPAVERRRMPSLDHLRERAELQLRIDRQGLTAGFFGDPPPGRSALDKRSALEQGVRSAPVANSTMMSAAGAAVQRPSGQGGSDVR